MYKGLYKNMGICLAACREALVGKYANFGVMAAFNDASFGLVKRCVVEVRSYRDPSWHVVACSSVVATRPVATDLAYSAGAHSCTYCCPVRVPQDPWSPAPCIASRDAGRPVLLAAAASTDVHAGCGTMHGRHERHGIWCCQCVVL